MTVVTVGIDLAKNVFAVHGVNAAGKAVLVKPLVRRAKLLELIATLPACLIGIEAWAYSSNYGAATGFSIPYGWPSWEK